MVNNIINNLGRIIKQQRAMSGLMLRELSIKSGISSPHLGCIERGERFPSARILRKIAEPLGIGEAELFSLANYLCPQTLVAEGATEGIGRLDSYAARILSQEPVEVQRAIVGILSILRALLRR